jgi:hypothetical protein
VFVDNSRVYDYVQQAAASIFCKLDSEVAFRLKIAPTDYDEVNDEASRLVASFKQIKFTS